MATVTHVVLPGQVIGEAESRARETVASFLRRVGWSTTTLPTICIINGAPVLRAQWRRRRIRKGDVVVFQSRPRGGGGGSSTSKSIMGLVGVIALAALAPGVGALAAGALQFSGATGIASSAFVAGGAFLLNTLLSPTVASTQQTPQESLYTFGAQTNSARPLQTIPVKYGRVLSTPDYAAVPWSEFVGDDQYLHLLLVRGCGRYQPHQIRIDDTVLWTAEDGVAEGFEGVELQWCEPGEDVTLFPLNVAASVEVSGQELASTSTWVGGYVANAAGTSATALMVDLIWPQGLYLRNADGSYSPYLARTRVEYRPVNSLGLPTGEWSTLIVDERWGSSTKPLRASLRVEVPAGRYEVRARRDVPEGFASNAQDQVLWAGLRAALTGPRSFADVSVLAVRMKSTAQLTQASSGRFALLETRILPVWTGSGWSEQPTRNPGWAFLDAATNPAYGARRPLTKVDVQAAATLAATAAARGDCFDHEFRDAGPAVDALDTILGSCRARTRWLGDVLSLVRDEWQALPSMMLTDREIVRGSFAVDYLFQSESAADAVIVEYLDEETWRAEEVQVPADVVAQNPMRFHLKGVVQRAQASREGAFLWKQNTYRRVRPSLSTEHDGRLLSLGSTVTVQSEIPSRWGQSGAVAWHVGRTLALDPAPSWVAGSQHYMSLRTRTGRPFGPVKVARGASDAEALLDAADLALVEGQQGLSLEEVLARPNGGDLPSFALGVGTAWIRRAKVLSGSPDGDRVALSLVVDVPEVHDDSGDPGAVPPAAALSIPKAPLVAGLVAKVDQNVLEPVLSASWWPAAGALYYAAQVSYDGRATWLPLVQAYAASLSVVVEPRALSLRVAAVGSGQGAWSVVDLEAPTIDAGLIKVDTSNVTGSLAEALRQMGEVNAQFSDALNASNLASAEALAALANIQREHTKRFQVMPGEVRAEVSTEVQKATGPDSSLARRIDTVVATTDDLASSVIAETTARSEGDTALAESISEVLATTGEIEASVAAESAARASADSALATITTTLDSRLDTAESNITGQSSSIATLNSQVSTLSTTTSALSGTVTTHESRLNTAEGSITSLGSTQATHTSQIASLSTTTSAISTNVTALNSSLTNTNNYISANLNMKLTTAATPSGAVAAAQIQVIADGKLSGLYIVSTTTDAYIAIESEKLLLRSSSGSTPIAVFNVVSGQTYLKMDIIQDGSLTNSKVATRTLQTDSIALGGVEVDNLALLAATNYTASYTEGSVTSNPIKSNSLTRVSGTTVDLMVSLEIRNVTVVLAAAGTSPGTLSVLLSVFRDDPGGGTTTVLSRRVMMTVTQSQLGLQWIMNGTLPFYSIPFTDTNSAPAGTYTYRMAISDLEYNYAGTSGTLNPYTYGADVRYSYLKTNEFRR